MGSVVGARGGARRCTADVSMASSAEELCSDDSFTSLPEMQREGGGHQKTIGLMAVAFIVYFNVSGGPFGCEDIVSSCGPLPGFIGLFIFMILWGLPVALVTTELSTAMPDNGGYSIWVSEAFGEFWGFQESFLSWSSGVVDNALYPVLAYQTAVRIFGGMWGDPIPDEDSDIPGMFSLRSYICKLVLVAIFTLPNFFSTRSFGLGLGVAFVFVVMPFLVFAPLSLYNVGGGSWSNLLATRQSTSWSDWGDLAETLYWNWSGFDCVSTCAGEVRNPRRSFLGGMMVAMALVLFSYVVPLSAAIANGTPSWDSWEAGWIASIGLKQVGHWMASWIVLAAFVSNFGQYTAELFEDSWQLAGMADVGMLPKAFGHRSTTFGTPMFAVCFQMVLIAGFVAFDFRSILVVDNCLSVLGTLLELAAFVKLRLSRPEMERPYSIPVRSLPGLLLFLLCPFCLGSMVLVSCFTGDGGFAVPLINTLGLACGPLLYLAMKRLAGSTYSHREDSPVLDESFLDGSVLR